MVQYSPSVFEKKCFGARFSLFVLVVAVGGEDKDDDFGVVDFVDETVFLRDAAAPLPRAVACKRLRLSGTGAGM